jgi:peroxiredoxin (alkyl hydroperoxide reductase subunit C)
VLTVGDRLPRFRLPVQAGAGEVAPAEVDSSLFEGRWLALLYWPKDIALICPDELSQLERIGAGLRARNAMLVAATTHADAAQPRFPAAAEHPLIVLADVEGELATALGLGSRAGACTLRATFVADPTGRIRWVRVSDLSAGRCARELAEVLDTLQAGIAPLLGGPAAAASELIVVCAWCRRLRDQSEWHVAESFIRRRTGAEFSHGICRDCLHEGRYR